jgi:hypothetical protein
VAIPIFLQTPFSSFSFIVQTGVEEMALKKELVAPNSSGSGGTILSMLSKIRVRNPAQEATCTHRLDHLKTDSEHLVRFDGPNDPYKPLNWSFTKKSVTTILYGFITMGMFSVFRTL